MHLPPAASFTKEGSFYNLYPLSVPARASTDLSLIATGVALSGKGGGGGGGDNPANCASACQYCQGYNRCAWSQTCVNRYGQQYGWGCYY
jgi:hypothetical protein